MIEPIVNPIGLLVRCAADLLWAPIAAASQPAPSGTSGFRSHLSTEPYGGSAGRPRPASDAELRIGGQPLSVRDATLDRGLPDGLGDDLVHLTVKHLRDQL